MGYPSILQYLESLSNPRQLCSTLCDIELVRDYNDEPVFSSGSFGVVFKIRLNDHIKAVKCFTRPQIGREKAYGIIKNEFKCDSVHTIGFEYIENEIGVFGEDGNLTRYPMLLMDWVEGHTLDLAIQKAVVVNDKDKLRQLSVKFDKFALWLLDQSFTHGDIKPENIIINQLGKFVLVDYDGLFLPSMEGESQREVGTFGYQHFLRPQMKMCKEIDDYSIAILSLMLKALALNPTLFVYAKCGSSIFDPQKLFEGGDLCYNELKKSELVRDELLDVLCSRVPQIANLRRLIKPLKGVARVANGNKAEQKEIVKRVRIGGRFGFANLNNDIVGSQLYGVARDYVNGFACVCLKRRWGVIDVNENVVVPQIYDQIRDYSEGVFAVQFGDKWGYVDKNGVSFLPLKYANAWSFSCGRGLVKVEQEYGFVDKAGCFVIEPQFEYAYNFSDNFACVKSCGKYGYIDLEGNWVLEPVFDTAHSVKDGFAVVGIDGKEVKIEMGVNMLSKTKLRKVLSDIK